MSGPEPARVLSPQTFGAPPHVRWMGGFGCAGFVFFGALGLLVWVVEGPSVAIPGLFVVGVMALVFLIGVVLPTRRTIHLDTTGLQLRTFPWATVRTVAWSELRAIGLGPLTLWTPKGPLRWSLGDAAVEAQICAAVRNRRPQLAGSLDGFRTRTLPVRIWMPRRTLAQGALATFVFGPLLGGVGMTALWVGLSRAAVGDFVDAMAGFLPAAFLLLLTLILSLVHCLQFPLALTLSPDHLALRTPFRSRIYSRANLRLVTLATETRTSRGVSREVPVLSLDFGDQGVLTLCPGEEGLAWSRNPWADRLFLQELREVILHHWR